MTSVGPPQFDFDTKPGAVPEPPPPPARSGLVAVLGVGLVMLIVGLVAVLWDPAVESLEPPRPEPAAPTSTEAPPDEESGRELTTTPGPRYDFNVAGIAVHGVVATDDGFMAYAAGPEPGTIARLTSVNGRRWVRSGNESLTDLPIDSVIHGLWRGPDGRYLGAFGESGGRSLTWSVSTDGISWTPLATFDEGGPVRSGVVAVGAETAIITNVTRAAGTLELTDQMFLDLDTGELEPLALSLVFDDAWPFELDDDGTVIRPMSPPESQVIVRTAVADPATGGFVVVATSTESFGSEGTLHQIRRILPDGRAFPFVGPHPWLVEELGVVNGEVVAFTDSLAFRLDPETSRWSSATAFREDESQRFVDVTAGPGGAAVLLAEGVDFEQAFRLVVTRNALEWENVVIDEPVSNPQLRVLGEGAVIVEGFQPGVGTVRLTVPLDG